MFGIFQDKNTKLEKKYAKLLAEVNRLSHTSRRQSDEKAMEAAEVLQAIKDLENEGVRSSSPDVLTNQ